MGEENETKVALVTGATGLLGSAVSAALARSGWKVALLCHSNQAIAQQLLDRIQERGGVGAVIPGDLRQPHREAARIVADVRKQLGVPYCLVHCASTPLRPNSFLTCPPDLEHLIAVQVTSFLALVADMLPEMLRAQTGTFVAILSSALQTPAIPGWHAYTVAKAAMAQAVNELSATYGAIGIRALSVIPGAIRSQPEHPGVTRDVSGTRNASLDAHDVARAVVNIIEGRQFLSGAALRIDEQGLQYGRCFAWNLEMPHTTSQEAAQDHHPASPGSTIASHSALYRRIGQIMCDLFGVDETQDLSNASIGSIPGWDSLAHITLIMEIESAFQVQFQSEETSTLTSVSAIARAIHKRLGSATLEVHHEVS